MAGSKYAMPIIVLNMGGEMVYILHQRLQAQNVTEDKARKVLQDVVRAMYSPLFVKELFKPQDMYSAASTKQIFEKLAHSSIMRLNKSSMDKLYDLMLMGFKYQLLQCNGPQQYLHITLNHLESLKDLMADDVVADVVQVAIDRTIETYIELNNGQWNLLKQSLLRFVQGKRVKVSLFLQQQIQTMDGVLILNNEGKLPFGTEVPGDVRFYESGSLIATKTFHSECRSGCSDTDEVLDSVSKLGLNMYSKVTNSRANTKPGCTFPSSIQASRTMGAKGMLGTGGSMVPSGGAAAESLSGAMTTVHLSSPKKANTVARSAHITESSAKAELNMLSDLLGMHDSGDKPSADAKPFKINLFPNSAFDQKDDDSEEKEEAGCIVIDIDAAADAKSVSRYWSELDMDEDNKAGSAADSKGGDDEDDLLALMDSAK